MPAAVKSPLPPWFRVSLPSGENYERIKALSSRFNLHTVCEEARCPNVAECWGGGTATFMVMGDTCTRGCRFCSVKTAKIPGALDPGEPEHLAKTLEALRLDYVVITSVCRDDITDQGAGHLARCIGAVKERNPEMLVEVLIPDFRGEREALKIVADSGPEVVAHNLETVERLTPKVRDRKASYRQSLEVLRSLKEIKPSLHTKSSLMLGLGEIEEEIIQSLKDLRAAGTDFLTLGQYLRPTGEGRHIPVQEYVSPERFGHYKSLADSMGFLYTASGPLVRSSYRAGEFFLKSLIKKDLK